MFGRKVRAYALIAICFSMLSCDGLSSAHQAWATTLAPGTIVVGVSDNPQQVANPDTRLIAVDPTTGSTSVLSGDAIGTGPSLTFDASSGGSNIRYISQQNDGSLLVVDNQSAVNALSQYESRLYRVDPNTGNRSLIADITSSTDSGVINAARQVGNTIFATTKGGLETIDPTTGVVTPFAITGIDTVEPLYGFASLGTDLYVGSNFPALYKISAVTGAASILSSSTVGTGPTISPADLSFDSAGNLYALGLSSTSQGDNSSYFGIYRIDPATGDRVAVSETFDPTPTQPTGTPVIGSGPVLQSLAITTADNGAILAINYTGALLSIDPTTGNRTLVSQVENKAYPVAVASGIVVLHDVPEPSTLMLAALGGLALLAIRRRR
ncbi:MAG TPA: PEP-CTERM sorting domain-containing protein [Pirellulales bacterium]|jgi:hypothetical protein